MNDSQFAEHMGIQRQILAAVSRLIAIASGDKAAAAGLTGWKAVLVPEWARYDAGTPLGLLGKKGLDYWLAWHPKPYTNDKGKTYPIKPDDAALRASLDEAAAAIASGAYVPPQFGPKRPRSDTPAAQRQDRGDDQSNDEPPPF